MAARKKPRPPRSGKRMLLDGLVSLMLTALLTLLWVFGRDEVLFAALKWSHDDSVNARALAGELAKTEHGLRLALADADVFGGETGGWSSYVLRCCRRHKAYVKERLISLIEAGRWDRSSLGAAAGAVTGRCGLVSYASFGGARDAADPVYPGTALHSN